ncbi:MAG: hypothetical protein R6X17_07650 [Candidatus Competibacteraceae bacterium]
MNRNVPSWNQLRKYDHDLLTPPGYGNPWFDSQPDEIRLTVLTLYVKLSGIKFWKYVNRRDTIYPGRMEFRTTNVRLLKQELTRSPQFRSPAASDQEWDSVELRYEGSLHFKHPLDKRYPWPPDKVQAHIDKVGWLGAPPVSLVHHVLTYSSYKDPFVARKILLDQGWDPVPLVGIGVR